MTMHISNYMSLVFLTICTYVKCVNGKKDESIGTDSGDQNFYSFPVMDIHEDIFTLDRFKGKVSLVVNVASHCGYTDSHYYGLKSLQETFAESDVFTVLAFPCNQFGQQEPGNHRQIYDFAHNRMGANFPIFAKINVVDEDVSQPWLYLIENTGKTPTWNFWKYLVDHNGYVIDGWGPNFTPDQLYHVIQAAVDIALKAKDEREKMKKPAKDEF